MKYEVTSNGTLVSTVSGTTINLTGLTPATKYSLKVVPTNGLEIGSAATVTFTTLAAAPNPNIFSVLQWIAKSTGTSSMHQFQYVLKPSTTYTVSTSYLDPSGGYYYDMWCDKKSVALSSGVNPLSKSKVRKITTDADGILVLGIRDGQLRTAWQRVRTG